MGVPHSDNCVKVSLKNKIVFIASIKRWRLHNHLDLLFGLSVLCLFVSYITGKRMSGFEYQNIRGFEHGATNNLWHFEDVTFFFYFLRLFHAPQTGRGGGMRSRSASCSKRKLKHWKLACKMLTLPLPGSPEIFFMPTSGIPSEQKFVSCKHTVFNDMIWFAQKQSEAVNIPREPYIRREETSVDVSNNRSNGWKFVIR